MTQKLYADEYLIEAVRLATSKEKSTTQTVRDLGISENTLYTWVKLYGPRKEGETEPHTPDERQELIRLRRENRRLPKERDILKSR
ncbi:MAG TPA: transposase [Armatimonadota bacterium]|nr:transposase [Armatimonadota bacterium]